MNVDLDARTLEQDFVVIPLTHFRRYMGPIVVDVTDFGPEDEGRLLIANLIDASNGTALQSLGDYSGIVFSGVTYDDWLFIGE